MRASITTNFDLHARVDFPALRKYVHVRLKTAWRKSVRAFIETASSQLAIDTGMSVAQFAPLAKEVRIQNIIKGAITGALPRKNSYHGTGQFQGVGTTRSSAHGEILGRKAYDLSFGTPANPNFIFNFRIVVLQYYLHENGLATPDSYQYESLKLGQDAFLNTFNRELENILPKYLFEQLFQSGKVPFIGETDG